MIGLLKKFLAKISCNHTETEYIGIVHHMEKQYRCLTCGKLGNYKLGRIKE